MKWKSMKINFNVLKSDKNVSSLFINNLIWFASRYAGGHFRPSFITMYSVKFITLHKIEKLELGRMTTTIYLKY